MVYESGDQQDLSSTEDPGKNGHEIQHEFMSMVNWLPTATVAEFALDSLHKPSTSVSAEKAIIDEADLYFLVDMEIVVNAYAWWQRLDSELGRMVVVPWMVRQLQRALTDLWFLVFAVKLFVLSGVVSILKRLRVAASMELR